MIRQLSLIISRGSLVLLAIFGAGTLFFLVQIDAFAELARRNLGIPIQWQTVQSWQWYALWVVTAGYAGIGAVALVFLRRAFGAFARGELFNPDNSRALRIFAILMFAQGLAKPLHHSVSSVLLSLNHPAGQKMLSVSFGSGAVMSIALGIILWVVSELLLVGFELESDNKQFV